MRDIVIRNDRNFKATAKSDGGAVLVALLKSKFKSFYENASWITIMKKCILYVFTWNPNTRVLN
jgi:hypothetical protein